MVSRCHKSGAYTQGRRRQAQIGKQRALPRVCRLRDWSGSYSLLHAEAHRVGGLAADCYDHVNLAASYQRPRQPDIDLV